MGNKVEGGWKLRDLAERRRAKEKVQEGPEGQGHRQEAKKVDLLYPAHRSQPHACNSLFHQLDDPLELDFNSLPSRLTPESRLPTELLHFELPQGERQPASYQGLCFDLFGIFSI